MQLGPTLRPVPYDPVYPDTAASMAALTLARVNAAHELAVYADVSRRLKLVCSDMSIGAFNILVHDVSATQIRWEQRALEKLRV